MTDRYLLVTSFYAVFPDDWHALAIGSTPTFMTSSLLSLPVHSPKYINIARYQTFYIYLSPAACLTVEVNLLPPRDAHGLDVIARQIRITNSISTSSAEY